LLRPSGGCGVQGVSVLRARSTRLLVVGPWAVPSLPRLVMNITQASQHGQDRRHASPVAGLTPSRPGVLLGKAKDGDVLLGVALHQIDQKAPQGRVLRVAQLT